MAKFLITGVSGFVSHYFIEYLEQNKIEATVLGLDISDYHYDAVYEYVQLSCQKVDLLDATRTEDIITSFRPDYILHLASYSSVAFSWKNPNISFQNNTNIFLNLIEAVRKQNLPTRMLSIGSSEEYGNINIDHLPLSEELPLDPISPYAVARVSQEMLSKVYCEGYNVDVVMTRSFNHIGPRQKEMFVVSSFAKRIAEFSKQGLQHASIETGDLSIIRDFLDVRDVVQAYYLLLIKGHKGDIYNICSGKGLPLGAIIDLLSKVSGIQITTHTNPDFIRPNDNKIIIGSNTKIKSELGWKPSISIEQSVNDIYQYWLNN